MNSQKKGKKEIKEDKHAGKRGKKNCTQ